ncbi:hypothetical protein EA772_20810 [Pedobacter sp. G11]|uniref:hypothetical protein n=1 Tax=Pedobacter sp. G11 TaxID=2482728 RepID=UPI000F5E4A31|nr:hypothetical protein [Pedobacter sp. G11]AZI27666.1 hypothetical protein EA772_20810 [Pedobacter sp. G11]
MKTCCTFLLLFIGFTAFAQKSDSTRIRKSAIGFDLIEESTELKSKPHIKNGSARVFLHNKIVATGLYRNNERVGKWRFFDKDSLSQVYNYNLKQMEFNIPDTTLHYNIDSLNQGDKVTYPIKIGMMNNLYWYLTSTARIPKELEQKDTEYQVMFYLYISKLGRIDKTFVNYSFSNNNKSYQLIDETNRFKYFEFSPATVNGSAVDSQMILKVSARIGN